MKERLRIIAWWGNSFEKWFQQETVFALEPKMQEMQKLKGHPWDYESWDIEYEYKGVKWDMAMRGEKPLFLQFKICIPCWGIPTKVKDGPNSLTDDIENVRKFTEGAAAALLFALEHKGAGMPLEEAGFPPPKVRSPEKIKLGKTWCAACEEDHQAWARIYCWANAR